MAIQLRIAGSTEDKSHVYRLRRRVFIEQERRFDIPEDHIFDRYDSFDETTNIVAFSEGQPVAGIRVTLDNPAGLPSQQVFDFTPLRKKLSGGCACVGWFCVSKAFRHSPGLIVSLIQMCFRQMRKTGARHVLSVLHPPALPLLSRMVGAKAVGPQFREEGLGVDMTPVHVDLERLPPGSRERFVDPSEQILDDSPERRLYHRNEVIISEGDLGGEVFQVMRGVVRIGSQEGLKPARLLMGPGQLFGELAAIDGGRRTATLAAHSQDVDVMVWDRQTFIEQLRASPDRMFRIFELMAARFRRVIGGGRYDSSTALAARLLVGASRPDNRPVDTRWLARQCGLDRRALSSMVTPWEREQLIAADAHKKVIRVIDGCALARKIEQ